MVPRTHHQCARQRGRCCLRPSWYRCLPLAERHARWLRLVCQRLHEGTSGDWELPSLRAERGAYLRLQAGVSEQAGSVNGQAPVVPEVRGS